YIYTMRSRLVNVRLDEARLRKARALRERGIVISDLVREAIDARYSTMADSERPRDAQRVIANLFAKHPDPPGQSARDYDVADAKAARQAIGRHLKRKRS